MGVEISGRRACRPSGIYFCPLVASKMEKPEVLGPIPMKQLKSAALRKSNG